MLTRDYFRKTNHITGGVVMNLEDYNRDLFRATERMLFEHPSIRDQLRIRAEYIEAECRWGGEFVDVGKSSVRPVNAIQEKTLIRKEGDPEFQFLSLKCDAIETAVKHLPLILRDFVSLFYWQKLPRIDVMCELHIGKSTFTSMRNRTIRRVSPFVRAFLDDKERMR